MLTPSSLQDHDPRTRLHATAENFFAPSEAYAEKCSAMAERTERLKHLVEAMEAELLPAFECAGAGEAEMHEIRLWVAGGQDLVEQLTNRLLYEGPGI